MVEIDPVRPTGGDDPRETPRRSSLSSTVGKCSLTSDLFLLSACASAETVPSPRLAQHEKSRCVSEALTSSALAKSTTPSSVKLKQHASLSVSKLWLRSSVCPSASSERLPTFSHQERSRWLSVTLRLRPSAMRHTCAKVAIARNTAMRFFTHYTKDHCSRAQSTSP
eukprot:2285126-Pleurochrysis_carterae.AAC.1